MNFINKIENLKNHLDLLSAYLELQNQEFGNLIESAFIKVWRGGGHRICITGVGKNASLAMKASETFASLGIPSLYLNTCHLSHGDFGFVGPEDIVIHLSRSGTTEEMLGSSIHLREIKPKVTQILLTCRRIGTFDRMSTHSQFDEILYTGEVFEMDKNSLAPTISTSVLLALLDLIGTEISEMLEFSKTDFLKYHPGGALGEKLRKEMV